ncbi:MAG: MFS transporter [Phycisphaerae bacterium]
MTLAPAEPAEPADATFRQKAAWCVYDWANSGYGLIIVGPLFAAVFEGTMLPALPPESATAEVARGLFFNGTVIPPIAVMGFCVALSSLMVMVAAPVLGAVADMRGWTKGLMVGHAVVGSFATFGFLLVGEGQWLFAAALYVVGNYCFGASLPFYNAYLPHLVGPSKQGSLSGWGFAVGYIGGAVALVIALFLTRQLHYSYGLAFAGVWWLTFTLPAALLLPKLEPVVRVRVHANIVFEGFRRVFETLRNIRRYRMLFLFLLAFLVYNNGIDTVINISPIYASSLFGFDEGELVAVFLVTQCVAFVGAMVMGYLADRIGNKTVVVMNLLGWCIAVAAAYFAQTQAHFWMLSIGVGIVIGGAQSSSRALMSSLAPREIRAEAFGFYSLSGKAISAFGPLILAFAATMAGSRAGVLAVLPFLVIGLVMLLFVKTPARGVEPT